MDLKSLYLLNTRFVTCRAVGLCGFRNSLLVFEPLPKLVLCIGQSESQQILLETWEVLEFGIKYPSNHMVQGDIQ